MKVPCISFDVKVGPSEIINNGKNGILIPPFDCEKMIEEIDRLIMNPSVLEEMSEETMSGLDRFSDKNIIEKWKSIFNEL